MKEAKKKLTRAEKKQLKKLNKATAKKVSEKVGKRKSSVGTFFKYTAACFAITFGLIALYYCLLPALAEEEYVYVYFDNGLSKYDTVYYSTDGGINYKEMMKLVDASDKMPSDTTNVNAEYTYVSQEKVKAGETKVIFKGEASGIVYDTVTNYRIGDGTREWGYNYEGFNWTSDEVLVYDGENCYYAPPQLMEYKYGGYVATVDGGVRNYTTFIYAHGDTKDDGTTSIAQPGDNNSNDILEPNTGLGRTFYDGQYSMIGKLGSVNDKNDLGDLSQSVSALNGTATTYEGSFDALGDGNNGITFGTNVYHATAQFYDYYSDWELAGNILEELQSVYDVAIKRFNFEEESFTIGLLGDAEIVQNPDDANDTVLYIPTESSGSYASIDMSEISEMDFANGFSISMNVRPGENSTDWNYIFGIGTRGTTGKNDWSYFDGTIGFIQRKDMVGGAYAAYVPGDGWIEGNKIGGSSTNNLYNYLITTGKNQWHHLTYVYGKDEVSVYVDGVLTIRHEATKMDTILASLANGNTFNIGAGIDPIVNNFAGYIDDVVVYATELVKEDVWQIAQDTQVEESGTTATATTKEPVIEYSFDYTSGMTFVPVTEGATNEVYVYTENGENMLYISGDGVANKGGYVSIDVEDVLKKQDFSNGITISMNVKPSDSSEVTNEWRYLFGIGTNGYTEAVDDTEVWSYVDGTIGFIVREGDPYSAYHGDNGWVSGNTVNNDFKYFKDGSDEWRKLTFVYSPTEISIYLDNVLIRTQAPTDSTNTSAILQSLNSGNTFNIGAGIDPGLERYAGYIDDVMIYDSALTSTEVAQIQDKATEEIKADVEYNFDITSTLTAFKNTVATRLEDILAKNPNNKNDNVLYFEEGEAGTGTYVSIAPSVIDQLDFSKGFSISMNVMPRKKDSTDAANESEGTEYKWSDTNYLFGMGINGTKAGTGVWRYIDGSIGFTSRADSTAGYVEYVWSNSELASTATNVLEGVDKDNIYNYFYSDGAGASKVNDWYKLTYVYAKDSISVYVDGVLVGKQAATNIEAVLAILNTANTFNIGMGIDTNLDSYGGYVDDVRVYSKALTSVQVEAIAEKVATVENNEILQYEKFGTFSQGTNRISYTYQGLHWNDAISTYYENVPLGRALTCALYFGSNSWMTGNNRYYLEDRNGNALFTQEQVNAANDNQPTDYIKEAEASNENAYLQPLNRQYLATLWGFSNDLANIMHGNSNSRGVENLVELIDITNSNGITEQTVSLLGTSVETPYFNKEFIEGDNEVNAVYGKVYEDVGFDFIFNEDTGYYEYDSTKYYYATRLTQNKYTGEYYMHYTNQGVTKADASEEDKKGSSTTSNQYYPFNSIETNSTFSTENLMFGMHLDIPFSMYVDPADRRDNIFKFSGDDDVWVYVDGIKVLDMGGTHAAVGGIVDLKNEYSVIGSVYNANTGKANSDFTISSSGEDASVTATEKAAFAIMSTNGIDPSLINTEIQIDEADFFDDIYRPATDGGKISYTYNIKKDSATGESYLQVHYWNAVAYDETETDAEKATSKIDDANEGYAVFALEDLDIPDSTEAGADIQDHELSVYYMERGLNSSNLKLAFNFVPSTEREIEKVWNDGEEEISDTDSIKVELYRTEPTTLSNQLYALTGVASTAEESTKNSEYMVIRSVAYQSDGTAKERDTFAVEGSKVSLQYKPQDENNTDSAMILTINGITITKEIFEQLQSSIGLNIYINNGEAIDSSSFISLQQDDGTMSEAMYLDLPTSADRNMVRIEFDAVSEGRYGYPGETEDMIHDTWNIYDTNGWLIETHAVSMEAVTPAVTDDTGAVTIPAVKKEISHIGIPEEKMLAPATIEYIIVKGNGDIPDRQIYVDDMEFTIVRQKRAYSITDVTYYQNNIRVIASLSKDEVSFGYGEKSRYIVIRKRSWDGHPGTSGEYEIIYAAQNDAYTKDAAGNVTAGGMEAIIREETDTGTIDVWIDVYQNESHYNDTNNEMLLGSLDYPILSALWDPVVYGNSVLVGEAKTLNSASNWKATWDNITDSTEIDGVVYSYNYFIREVAVVKKDHTDQVEDYNATYYDENGEEIKPTLITVTNDDGTEEQVAAYSVDGKDYIKLINTPATDVQVSKVWSTTAVRKESVVISIYKVVEGKLLNGSEYVEYVTSVTLTEADLTSKTDTKEIWSQTIENLPLYETIDGVSKKITYYALEEKFGEEYIVNYSSTEVKLKDSSGNEDTYYPLNTTDDSSVNTITVTNRPNNSGLFDLKVYKQAELDDTPALAGAVFSLEKITDKLGNSLIGEDGYGEIVTDINGNTTFTTGEDGYIHFGDLEGGATYRLTEVEAPLGFMRDETPIIFTVTADEDNNLSYSEGNVTSSGTSYISSVWDEITSTLTFTVENAVQPVILPDTGGGIVQIWLIGIGLLLIALTGASLYYVCKQITV